MEWNGIGMKLLTTPEPTEVVKEHPFEDEAYFEELFADIQKLLLVKEDQKSNFSYVGG